MKGILVMEKKNKYYLHMVSSHRDSARKENK